MRLYLLEPDTGSWAWAPFGGVSPVAEWRVGAYRIRERWERTVGRSVTAIIDDRMAGYRDVDSAPVQPAGEISGPAIVADARFAPRLSDRPMATFSRLTAEGRSVAWHVAEGQSWSGPHDDGEDRPIDGLALEGAGDILDGLDTLLAHDARHLAGSVTSMIPPGSIVLGASEDVVLHHAEVEPGVVFDVRGGPVVIDGGTVRSGTRLEGPIYLGPGTVILGGSLRNSAIGPECRVRGEVASSVFMGYANKAHDGFLGHSVVGQWANLGALTTTSNLKNTYGTVRLQTDAHRWDTRRQFLGSLIGDHAKIAIGTMLGTGTIIGAGANVFGAGPVPKYLPPFAWGSDGNERMSATGFLTVASRVMPRRGVEWTPEREASLAAAYARLTGVGEGV